MALIIAYDHNKWHDILIKDEDHPCRVCGSAYQPETLTLGCVLVQVRAQGQYAFVCIASDSQLGHSCSISLNINFQPFIQMTQGNQC